MVAAAACPAARAYEADAAEFYRSITGDWVGTCEQNTDGQPAEKKFFCANIRQTNPSTFESRFDYFRIDAATGKAVRAGDASVVISINPDGAAAARIVGKGTILVDHKPKPQQHEFTETQVCRSPGTLEGVTSGTIKISNMPLGLGKNGKIRSGRSSWRFSGDALSIDQKLTVGFRVLFFSKNFDVEAHYTARRGSDIAGLISRGSQVSLGPAGRAAVP